jgi:hypothetical protein
MNAPSEADLTRVWTRAGGCCERCGRGLLRGEGGYSIHHRRLKGSGGDRRPDTHRPGNLLLLCGSGTTECHGVVHHQQTPARDEGFIVSRWADPVRIAFKSALWGWAFIDHAGRIACSADVGESWGQEDP